MKNFGTKIKNAFDTTLKATPVFLSVIAVIAIMWYIRTYYSAKLPWWGNLALVSLIGLSAYMPKLANCFTYIWSIIATGLSLLMIQTVVKHFCSSLEMKFVAICVIILVIAIIVEFFARESFSTLHIAEILFDAGLAFISAYIIVNASNPVVTLITLNLVFCTTLFINFSCEISVKRKHKNETEEPEE